MSTLSNFSPSSTPCSPAIPNMNRKFVNQTSLLKLHPKFPNMTITCATSSPNPSSPKDGSGSRKSPGRATGRKSRLQRWIKENVSPGDRIGLVVCGERSHERTFFTFAHPNSATLVYEENNIQQGRPLKLFLQNDAITFVADPLTRQRLRLLGVSVKNLLVCYEKEFWGVSEAEVEGLGEDFTVKKAHWLCTEGCEEDNGEA